MSRSVVERLLSWIQPDDQQAHLEPRAFYSLCKKDPEAAKKLLRAEHRDLVDELERLMNTVEQRIGLFAERLKKATTESLEQDYLLLLRQREELLKLIERITLSELPTIALQEEWSDWQRYLSEVSQPEERAKQRVQLVRAELAMRGHQTADIRHQAKADRALPVRPVVEVREFVPSEFDEVVAKDQEGISVSQDDLDEWLPFAQAIEQSVAFWNKQHGLLMRHHTSYTPDQAAEIVRRYREAHQKLAEQDRLQGTRRYRLEHLSS